MWDRIRIGRSLAGRSGDGAGDADGAPPGPDADGRVPGGPPVAGRLAGGRSRTRACPPSRAYTVPLDGSGTTDAQTFTVTSSNPDIAASIVSGPFWTVNVQYTNPPIPRTTSVARWSSSSSTAPARQTLTRRTPSSTSSSSPTTAIIRVRVNTSPAWPPASRAPRTTWSRAVPRTRTARAAAGSRTRRSPTRTSSRWRSPARDQLAMANSGGTNSNDTQFFITTGSPNSELGYNYTIFGQMVPNPTSSTVTVGPDDAGQAHADPGHDQSQPWQRELAARSTADLHVGDAVEHATPAARCCSTPARRRPAQTATITVTATDPTNGPAVSQTFNVTVGAYAGPTDPSINFRPFANASTASTTPGPSDDRSRSTGHERLSGHDQARDADLLASSRSRPTGRSRNFNPSTGTLTYTPNPGFSGNDTLQLRGHRHGPADRRRRRPPATPARSRSRSRRPRR